MCIARGCVACSAYKAAASSRSRRSIFATTCLAGSCDSDGKCRMAAFVPYVTVDAAVGQRRTTGNHREMASMRLVRICPCRKMRRPQAIIDWSRKEPVSQRLAAVRRSTCPWTRTAGLWLASGMLLHNACRPPCREQSTSGYLHSHGATVRAGCQNRGSGSNAQEKARPSKQAACHNVPAADRAAAQMGHVSTCIDAAPRECVAYVATIGSQFSSQTGQAAPARCAENATFRFDAV